MHAPIPAAVISVLACTPVLGAGPVANHEALLVRALFANAAGECPASLMAASIKAECDEQLPGFKQTLVKLGVLRHANFQRMRDLTTGPAEVYRVTFEHGEMTWIIGVQDDGRICVLWAPNEPDWDIGSFSRTRVPPQ